LKDVWIVGATSHVAKALIAENLACQNWKLTLVARSPEKVEAFLSSLGYHLPVTILPMKVLENLPSGIEVMINCVGFGTPSKQREAGISLFWVTEEVDNFILRYLENHSSCCYVNFSSGAVYGTAMQSPVGPGAVAELALDPIRPDDWYRISKIHQETKHRAMGNRWIVDLRLFSFFSRFVDLDAGFLMSDVARALKKDEVLPVSATEIYRDYVAPSDLYRLIGSVFENPGINCSVDTYSSRHISKSELIRFLEDQFGLRTRSMESGRSSPTGQKPYYFSRNDLANRLFGYTPQLTTWDGIAIDLAKMGFPLRPGKSVEPGKVK